MSVCGGTEPAVRDDTVCGVDDASDLGERDCANSQTVRSVQRQRVGQRGLSRGGGVCPMCRLSDGEKRGTAQSMKGHRVLRRERDCRHAATRRSMYV